MPIEVDKGGRATALRKFQINASQNPTWPKVLVEGDSWFSYPNNDVPDEIEKLAGGHLSMLRLASPGDEIAEMLSGEQFQTLQNRLNNHAFDILLFSGGGNDIVGEDFDWFISKKTAKKPWEQCIDKVAFGDRIERIRQNYKSLIRARDRGKNKKCAIVTHGYDFPIPSDEPFKIIVPLLGPWMYPYMVKKGITDGGDQKAIAKWMLLRFSDMQKQLQAENPHFHYVDTQGTLSSAQWDNEIHPTAAGFKLIAAKYLPLLKQLAPVAFSKRKPAPNVGGFRPSKSALQKKNKKPR